MLACRACASADSVSTVSRLADYSVELQDYNQRYI
jgi:hypothetical protein